MITWTNWRVGRWHNGQLAILTNEGALIATMESGSEAKRLADAQLIVKAVNVWFENEIYKEE